MLATTRDRAWTCDARGVPQPTPVAFRLELEDDLVLRMRLSGICGTDVVKITRATAPAGAVLGHEVVGVVEQGPSELVGTRVAVAHHLGCGSCRFCLLDLEPSCPSYRENLLDPGGFATRLRVRHRAWTGGALVGVPDHLDDTAAIFFEPLACAVRGLRRGGLLEPRSPARRTLLLGAGGTGLLLLLAIRGLCPGGSPESGAVVVEPRPERRELALALGASHALAPEATSTLAPDFDLVIDAAGAATTPALGLRLLAAGGTLVLFAHGPAGADLRAPHGHLFSGERRIIGSYSSGATDRELSWHLLTSGRVDPRPLLDCLLPFDQADEALRRAVAGEVVKAALDGRIT